jgi:hypothetical protein
MEPNLTALPRQHYRPHFVSVLYTEAYPLLAIIAVLWVGNFLYFSSFGFYEDDWYYMPSAFNVPLMNTLHLRAAQMFFQGRPLQVLVQALVACAGAALGSIPALYFITFLFSVAKSVLAYFVLRLRFDRSLSTLTALLFVISPLTRTPIPESRTNGGAGLLFCVCGHSSPCSRSPHPCVHRCSARNVDIRTYVLPFRKRSSVSERDIGSKGAD